MKYKKDCKYEEVLHILNFGITSPECTLNGRIKKHLVNRTKQNFFLKTTQEHSTCHIQKIFIKKKRKNDSGEMVDVDLLYPPPNERLDIIKNVHTKLSHAGRDKMLPEINITYFWEGITKDVLNFLKNCEFCVSYKGRNLKQPLKAINVQKPRERLQFDVTKLQKDSHGYIGMATAIDCHTVIHYYFKKVIFQLTNKL